MKRKCLFDIFVDKRLKFKFLLLGLNIAPFNNSKISVKHDKSYLTLHISLQVQFKFASVFASVYIGIVKSLVVKLKQCLID